MRWDKRGLIFQPDRHLFPHGRGHFAQSPQALVCDDHIRIYFSTREREPDGMFLSHIAYVDFDRSMNRILGTSNRQVVALGGLGHFDEHGIFPMNVLRWGEQVLGYTSGWSRRKSVSVETSIGLARSKDGGNTFERVGEGPLLTSSLNEPFLVGDPFVLIQGSIWHMWYIFGVRWVRNGQFEGGNERVYKIGHATSENGIDWTKDGIQLIGDVLNADECQALPTVFERGGKYHMYFCYREAVDFRTNRERGYRLGYAWSADLRHWIRDDRNCGIGLSESGWDCDMMCYPHVFQCDGSTFLLYNGNEFGRAGFGMAVLMDDDPV